jgi:hypothetical protein
MSEIVLHIGPHKTGTTTIQGFLSHNRDALLGAGVDFPLLGRTEAGSQAHRHFSAYMRDIASETPEGFEAEVRGWQPEAEKCILSSEDFWFGSTDRQIGRLKDLLPGISRIIVFLRDPAHHIRSMYTEALKGKTTAGLEEFVAGHTALMERPKKGYAFYRYQENIARWQHHFPVV